MYTFSNESDYLRFYVNIESDQRIQSYMDATVSIEFSANGYSGDGNGYLVKDEMAQFCKDLLSLEKSRNGVAKLNSVSGDLAFEIMSIDRRGHMGVIFRVSKNGFLGDKVKSFDAGGFMEIDPYQLEQFSKESWVREYNS